MSWSFPFAFKSASLDGNPCFEKSASTISQLLIATCGILSSFYVVVDQAEGPAFLPLPEKKKDICEGGVF